MILKAPSPDVMNKLARSVLALYSYDGRPDDMSLPNQLRQAVELIARVPVIVAHAFAAKRHYYDNESLYLHRPQEGLSVAQNFLYSVRHDNRYTTRRPGCWICAWCSTPSTAAATTPPLPAGCSPPPAPTSIPPSRRRWAP